MSQSRPSFCNSPWMKSKAHSRRDGWASLIQAWPLAGLGAPDLLEDTVPGINSQLSPLDTPNVPTRAPLSRRPLCSPKATGGERGCPCYAAAPTCPRRKIGPQTSQNKAERLPTAAPAAKPTSLRMSEGEVSMATRNSVTIFSSHVKTLGGMPL